MDRRTALAFGLMAVVIIGFSILQNILYPPQPRPEAADSLGVAQEMTADLEPGAEAGGVPVNLPEPDPGESEAITDSPLTVADALKVPSGAPEEFLTVSTPLYRLKISSRGGRIVSYEALEHESHLGGPVQLIPEDIPATGNDALVFRMGEMPLGRADYSFVDAAGSLEVEGEGSTSVKLVTETPGGLAVAKIFTFHPDSYGYNQSLVLLARNEAAARQTLNMLGTPEDFRFSWNQGIAPTERIQKMEEAAMRSLAHVGDELHTKKLHDLKKNVEKVSGQYRGTIHYAGVQNKYFTVFGIVDDPDGAATEGAIRLGGDQETMTQNWSIDVPALRGVGNEVAVAQLQMFVGPATVELVTQYGHDLENGIDLGMRWIRPLSSLVLTLLNWMHQFIPNYGVIIIIFSIMTKLLFYPLSKKQTESMKKMQEIQPKMKALQEKYKNDKDKLNQATMKMYQEEGVNPLAGCLPLLVQMPVFFALYQGLNHTISLRGQPFVAWITDLSQPDALFQLPFELPFLGGDFNVLPILMALAMYYQGKVTPTSGGGGQMAAMTTMMPLIMVFIFYNMPSGLVLYWLVNTILQVYQSWKIHRTATHGGAEKA
jgi:YidC/Oxa1 family membrane protein insertase